MIDAYILTAVGIVYHSKYENAKQFSVIAFDCATHETKASFISVLLIECSLYETGQ